MSQLSSRRSFIKKSSIVGASIAVLPQLTYSNSSHQQEPKLRIGLIGVGLRGTNHLNNLLNRDDVLVTAICDIDPVRIKMAEENLRSKGQPKSLLFGRNDFDYRNLLALENVDAVIISTPWLWHTRMTKDAMEAGKYAGVEVSAANTLEECWDLVNTHERTGTHMMILENVNYRRDVLAILNMVRHA